MELHTSFEVLSDVLDRYESRGRDIRNVEVTVSGRADRALDLTMDVLLPFCSTEGGAVHPELEPDRASLTGDGQMRVEFTAPVLSPETLDLPDHVAASAESVDLTDGGVLQTVGVTVDLGGADSCARTTAHSTAVGDSHVADGSGAADDACAAEDACAADDSADEGDDTREVDAVSEGADDSVPSPERSTGTPTVAGAPSSTATESGRETAGESATADGGMPPDGAASAVDGGGADEGGVTATDEGTDEDVPPLAEVTDGCAPTPDQLDAVRSARDDDVPAYEDVEYLEQLYDVCDTFARMSDVIEMDVSSETVRRYMIEVGVHEPNTYETDRDADDDETGSGSGAPPPAGTSPDDRGDAGTDERLVTDDVGLPEDTEGVKLPEGVEVADMAAAVVESSAIFQVQRRLDLDRQQTVDLLEALDLLDLVLHRVADESKREMSYEQVATRIHQAPSGA